MADSLSFKDDEALADSQEHPGCAVVVHAQRYPVEKAQNLFIGVFSSMLLCGQHNPVPTLSDSRISRSSMILNVVSTKGRATLRFVLGQPVLILWSFLTGYLFSKSRKDTRISARPESSKIKSKRVRTKKKKDLITTLGKGEEFDKQEEGSPVTKRPSAQGKDSDGDVSASSAFRRLIVKGVLSSFIPRPGPLGRDIYSKNSAKSCIKESQIAFKSSYKRNAIASSYSSSLAQWPPERIYAPATGGVAPGTASGAAAEAAAHANQGAAPDAAAGATSGAAPNAAAGGTQGAASDAAIDATRGAAPDAAAGDTRGAAPDAAAGDTRGAAPDAAAGDTRGAAPDAAAGVTRGAAPDAAAGDTPGAASDAAVGATRGTAADAAAGGTQGAAPDAAAGGTRGAAPDAVSETATGAAAQRTRGAASRAATDATARVTRAAARVTRAAARASRAAATDADAGDAVHAARGFSPGAALGVAASTSARGTRGASPGAGPGAAPCVLPHPGPASSQSKATAKKGNEKGRSSSGNPKKKEKKQKKGKQAAFADAQVKQGDRRKGLPTSNIPRPVRRKIPLLLPHKRDVPLILPPAPELCFRITAEDFDLEKKTAMQQINKVLKGNGAKVRCN
ncbi:nuclear envelope pore membrane protein POM 121-like [Sigmodon hispidus]